MTISTLPSIFLQADMAATVLAEAAEIMRHVDHQGRVILVAEFGERGDVRRVGFHREQALGHDEDAVRRVLGADVCEPASAPSPVSR